MFVGVAENPKLWFKLCLPDTVHHATVGFFISSFSEWLEPCFDHCMRQKIINYANDIIKINFFFKMSLYFLVYQISHSPSQGLTATAAMDPAKQPDKKDQ